MNSFIIDPFIHGALGYARARCICTYVQVLPYGRGSGSMMTEKLSRMTVAQDVVSYGLCVDVPASGSYQVDNLHMAINGRSVQWGISPRIRRINVR